MNIKNDITKEHSKLLFKMLNEVNETMKTEYNEESYIEYKDANEFMIYNELWTM